MGASLGNADITRRRFRHQRTRDGGSVRARLAARIVTAALLLMTAAESAVADSRRLPAAWSGGHWEPGSERYGIEIEADVPIKMSDGIVLKADVVYPTNLGSGKRASGSFPVLLEQTPYRAPPSSASHVAQRARYFVTRGYIYVLAQVRGTHHSGGDFGFLSEREQEDGVGLVDWVAHRLTGSNGRIGLTGCSYPGLNQYFTAARLGKDSPVKAIAPSGMGADLYREPFFHGGAPTLISERIFSSVFPGLGTVSAAKYSLEILADIKTDGDKAYASAFWQVRAAASTVEQIVRNGIPVLVWSGWDDFYPASAPEAYAMFQNAFSNKNIWAPMAPDQPASGGYQLVMAPGTHCSGENGGPREEAYLQWFDTWVKGVDTGLQHTRLPLHLYELGSERWASTASYPLVTEYQAYYLNAGGELTRRKPEEDDGRDSIRYAQPSESRATLTYSTQPFAAGATLAGPIAASIYASSSNANLLLIADLFDVAPDDSATKISTGALIGSMRTLDTARTWYDRTGRIVRPYHAFAQASDLVPGEITRLDIAIQPRLAALMPGHRLRLILKTQSDVNECGLTAPDTAFPCIRPTVSQGRTLDGGEYDMQRSRTWASYLNLPVLERAP